MDYNNPPPKIVFDIEGLERPRSFQTSTPKIVQWVIKNSGGVVKNEEQAGYVLIGFVVVAITISLFLVFGGGASQKKFQKPSPLFLEQVQKMQRKP